jgi:protein-disulfide isomerase
MEQKSQDGKEISITLNRDKLVNVVLAVMLGLLLVFGWQIYGLKQVVTDGPSDTTAKVAAPTPSEAGDAAAPSAVAADVPGIDDSDHVKGNKNAKITLIEYSDFECPFCARFHPTAQQALDEYDGDVNWSYRHFPLSFHATAQAKAEASECVAKLAGNDAFWLFADKMVANTSLPVADIAGLAASVGVKESALEDCLADSSIAAAVNADLTTGQNSGVTGTPGTFVYNNETGEARLIPGAIPYSQLKAAIDAML